MSMAKRKLFTIAAVSAITACGLVIDADKLVADRDKPDPTSEAGSPDVVATDAPNGGDTGTPVDAGDDGSISVVVPECVPQLPAITGAKGPYAVAFGPSGTKLACPSGYLATPVESGKGDFTGFGPATCANASACTCGAPSGSPSCGLRARHYATSLCGSEVNNSNLIGNTCTGIETENFLRVEYDIKNVTCPSTGAATTTPTAKTTPTFTNDYIVCAADPSVQTALCKGGETPLPPASNAAACITVPIGTACPTGANAYDRARDLSKTGTFTDTRTCNCQCSAAQTSCTGGAITAHVEDNCQGATAPVTIGMCQERNSIDSMFVSASPTPSGNTTCAAKATPSGTAVAQNDLRICCLP